MRRDTYSENERGGPQHPQVSGKRRSEATDERPRTGSICKIQRRRRSAQLSRRARRYLPKRTGFVSRGRGLCVMTTIDFDGECL
jgi:hypothetical protein